MKAKAKEVIKEQIKNIKDTRRREATKKVLEEIKTTKKRGR